MNRVIYTCNTGSYDLLRDHSHIMNGWDYICFTDRPGAVSKDGIWQEIVIEDKRLTKQRLSRLPKILPHIYLSKYDYSLYVDANIEVTSNHIEKRLEEFISSETLLSIRYHPQRDCIYEEAEVCIQDNLEKKQIVLKQVELMKEDGFPSNYGLYENNVIFRKHNHPDMILLGEKWWEMFTKYARRDQLSLAYLLWKYKIRCEPMFDEKKPVSDTLGLKYNLHPYSRSIDLLSRAKSTAKKMVTNLGFRSNEKP